MTPDYWPDFTPPEQIRAPIHILKEQGAILERKTKGIIRSEFSTRPSQIGNFWVGWDLYSPLLSGYSYHLLDLTYPPTFYPLSIAGGGTNFEVQNEKGFHEALAKILGSAQTKQIIEAIMVQATAAGEPVG